MTLHPYAIDTLAAFGSATLIAPAISIIDKAIFSNASGKEKMGQGIKSGLKLFLTRPLYFFRQPSCYLILIVYGGTYTVANMIQTICDEKNRPWHWPKFIGSSIANVSLSVGKDLYFTRAFGTGQAKKVPALSYSLYTIRDCMSVFASFNLPPLLTDYAVNRGWSREFSSVFFQLTVPCGIQFLSVPLHLYGMDRYNRPLAAWGERMVFVKKEYFRTCLARIGLDVNIGRILPAFGIGGVANTRIKNWGKSLNKQ